MRSDNSGGIESLYPFLYGGQSDAAAVMEQVRRSTEEKIREITALRLRLASEFEDRLISCAQAMAKRFRANGRLFAFGNGGSSTDAQAVAEMFLHPTAGRPLPTFSLTNDIAVVTALANDVGFDIVFARQIGAFATEADIAIGLSTSGNSENVLRGFEEANQRGLLTIGFAGYSGGKMAETKSIEYLFVVPSASIPRIQEAQTTLYDMLWALTHRALGAAAPETSALGQASSLE